MNKNNCNNYHPHSKLIFILLGILLLVACDSYSRLDGVTISSSPYVNVIENATDTVHTVTIEGERLDLVMYTLTGGADQSHFNIDQLTGELTFNAPPDFETPTDSDNNNTYLVEITVSDKVNTATQPLTVTVTDGFDFRIASTDVKTIEFAWTAPSTSVGEATFYRLFVNPDGELGFTLLQDNIMGVSHRISVPVRFTDWVNARYLLEAHNSAGRLNTTPVIAINQAMLKVIGYFKASNTDAGDRFGSAVSLSSDGATLAVGATDESSSTTGVNDPAQADNSAANAGAVYVFTRSGISWSQQAYIKASNTDVKDEFDEGDWFGSSVSLSSDGATLAVGARLEDSNATGINAADPAQADNSAGFAGAVYVFTRSGISWSQQAYIKASNTDRGDSFGGAVSLSSDGATLAVGANDERSIATGINAADPAQADNSAGFPGGAAGAVYVY